MTTHRRLTKRAWGFAIALVAVVGIGTSVSSATSGAHFFSASGSVNNSGSLTVSFDEAGVGQQLVNYSLHVSTASATYACINGGGNHPKAANKETHSSSLTTSASFNPTNGRVKASITTGPISAGSFSCPGGQRLVLASVGYSGITLTDTTNNTSTSIADVSRVFFNL
jgi:hypothetical protein